MLFIISDWITTYWFVQFTIIDAICLYERDWLWLARCLYHLVGVLVPLMGRSSKQSNKQTNKQTKTPQNTYKDFYLFLLLGQYSIEAYLIHTFLKVWHYRTRGSSSCWCKTNMFSSSLTSGLWWCIIWLCLLVCCIPVETRFQKVNKAELQTSHSGYDYTKLLQM